ncbi:MAG: J domain-containing protein [Leptolyngbya sp. Prado105]|nr:J domain-containing protein [Leptolyngbya sp. Prado105]
MGELERCYQLLGLEPGASMEEVTQAYKDLVFIWHPDRVPKDNPRLVQKAEAKIKELNQARDILRSHHKNGTAQKPAAQPKPSQQTYYQSYYYRPPTQSSTGHHNGHSTNGRQTNGHSTNGHSSNGHSTNGHSANGHSANGHSTSGHSEKQSSNPRPNYYTYQPYPRHNYQQTQDANHSEQE